MATDPSENPAETAGRPEPAVNQAETPQQQQPEPEAVERPAIPSMILLRKPNRQSKLKTLPEERQQEIIAFLEGDSEGRGRHTFKETVKWLRTRGIEVCISTVREFRDWWEEARERGAAVFAAYEHGFREVPQTGLPAEHVMKTCQAVLEEEALRNRDIKLYVVLQRLRHREQALEQRQIDLQIRNDIARNRAEHHERALACRERLVNLAIWKAHAREVEQKSREATREQAGNPQDQGDFDNYAIIDALRQAHENELAEVLASGDVVFPE